MQLKIERKKDALWVENGRILLKITDSLRMRPYLLVDGRKVTIAACEELQSPAFHIQLGGFLIDDFKVLWERLEVKDIEDRLGRGKRITLTALADQHGEEFYPGIKVESRVTLGFYENFPDVVTGHAEFTNLGEETLSIDRMVSNCFRLDRRMADPGEKPWRFASFQGGAWRWGHEYSLTWIESDTNIRNFLGSEADKPALGEGGGTPLVDLWAPICGLAVASAETGPRWISLPVKTVRDGLVEVCVVETPEARFGRRTTLAAGESCSTISSQLIIHRLDFHDALRIYADTLRVGGGVEIPLSSPEACYAPYWKSWGFGLDFTLEGIYGALDEIKSFGVEMAMLDDGWFTWYGDWRPSPVEGKFPGGDKDMREFVRRLKKKEFMTSLWWYPQGVSPESDLAREHPEWLIENRDGTRPACARKLYHICPDCPEAVAYIAGLVEKIMARWDYDGLYIDTTGLITAPPCFNPAHNHSSPLDSFTNQYKLYKAIYETAQRIKPGSPVEMCICSLPHDPFKMPYYNVANASDPVSPAMMRRRIKVEKAFRGPTFCVGDCYQIPIQEWEQWSVPESFESAMGTGAQMTTLYEELTPGQKAKWKRWFTTYKELGLSSGEYLNLYDLAFDKPEAHVVSKNGKLYYGFFAEHWSRLKPLALHGLEPGRAYRVRDYANDLDLGTVSGDKPELCRAFKEFLLLEVSPAG